MEENNDMDKFEDIWDTLPEYFAYEPEKETMWLCWRLVDLYSRCPGLDSKKPERYFGLFAIEEGPTVLLKWANLPESDEWVQDLLDVVAKKSSSSEETIFALSCLKWLPKNRSLSRREGFKESEDISATANLSTRFKTLTDGKYRGTEDLDKLLREVDRSAKEFIRRYGFHYKGLEDLAYPVREDLQHQVEDIEDEQETPGLDESFLKDFLEDKFMIMDMGQYFAGN